MLWIKRRIFNYLLWKSTQELGKLDSYASYQFIVSQLQIHPSLSAVRK